MKYWAVLKISWSSGFIYRLNFLLWRLRNVILILSIYFLWETIFKNNQVIFGYTREKILTYVFLTLTLRSFIMGVRSIDVGGEISDGRLSNYLVRPINYLMYWFTRDWADKLLNLIFSILELIIIFFVLRPEFYFNFDLSLLLLTFFSIALGIFINFLLGSVASYTTFWTPGNTWGLWFVYLSMQEVLSGILFPLDILPKLIYDLIMLSPFPYLLYFPANLYLGKFSQIEILSGTIIALVWVMVLFVLTRFLWNKGIRTYQDEGR